MAPVQPELGATSTAAGTASSRPVLERGATLDRYLVVGPLGHGGMGVVYTAYDPELDRKVAIKFLDHRVGGTEPASQGRARLVREARSLAKLAHPNVIAVYDAHSDGDDVFIVMELVDGQTVRKWVEAGARTWRAVLAVYLQAGRGLAAAHAAGLVHRDFKPANVLLGRDGRVRVLDFGLARGAAQGRSADTSDATSDLTSPDVVAGTIGYMAPEQFRGEPADASTDQFSFAIALYAGLYGHRPFAGKALSEIVKAASAGHVREPPRGTHVPEWVRRVLLRALSVRREDRYPSMDALLAELDRDPSAARWRALVWSVAALSVVALVATVYAVRPRKASAPLCGDPQAMLHDVWDDGVRGAVRASFVGSKAAAADATFGRVAPMLDAYAAKWRAADAAACADWSRRSDSLAGFRMACLDRRRTAMKALTEVFSRADAQIVSRAAEATYALPSPEECGDATQLRASVGLPDDPAQRAAVIALRTKLALAQSLLDASKAREAVQPAQEALDAARAVPHDGSEAEASLLLGMTRERLGDYPRAVPLEEGAVIAAERSGNDELVARASARLGFVLGDKLARFDEADGWLRLAEAASARAGNNAIVEADVAQARAVLYQAEGRPKDGLPLLEKAYALRQLTEPPEHPAFLAVVNNLGYMNQLVGRFDVAMDLHRRAVAVHEGMMGSDAMLAVDYCNLGSSSLGLGHYDEAAKDLTKAAELARQVSPTSFWIAWADSYLSLVQLRMGDASAATASARAGLAVAEVQGTPSARLIVPLHVDLGEALLAQGKPAEALAECQHAQDADDPRLVAPDALYEWDALTCIGLAELTLHRPGEALVPLERSVTLTQRVRAGDLAMARFALAQALVANGPDGLDRARALAEQAQRELGPLPWRKNESDEVAHWLAANDRRR